MALFPFMPWGPDRPALSQDAAQEALGVIATLSGYRPHQKFSMVATAINDRAQGAISVRDLERNIFTFAGDAEKLYRAAADGLTFGDVTRTVGGAYATPIDGWWAFWIFGNLVFGANGLDAIQSFDLGASTNFENAAGSPPVASFGITVRDFSVLLRVASFNNRVQWSALGDPTDYVASATTLSDSQDLADGGPIMGGVGGEYGLIGQQTAWTRMSFEGPPTAFRFDKITEVVGVKAERSIAKYGDLTFCLANEGVKMIRGGVEMVDIGEGQVDRYLESAIDNDFLDRVTGVIDPVNKTYVLGYASGSATDGLPDSAVVYHIPTGRFSRIEENHEILYSGIPQSGFTLETLDTPMPDIDLGTKSLDSPAWTGAGRPFLSGFNHSHEQGSFTGANMEAAVETGDAQLTPGRKSMVRQVRPIIQGSNVTPSVTVRGRNNMNEALTDSPTVAVNANGICPFRENWRYHRAKVSIPAASTWEHAVGVDDIVLSAMGGRG